jgi:hypothetical protein
VRAQRAALFLGFGLLLLAISPSRAGLVAPDIATAPERSIAADADREEPVIRAVLSAGAPVIAKGDERRERLVLPALLAVLATVLIGDPSSRRRRAIAIAPARNALVHHLSDGTRAPPSLLAI